MAVRIVNWRNRGPGIMNLRGVPIYGDDNPTTQFFVIRQRHGKPTVLVPHPGGYAVWEKPRIKFSETLTLRLVSIRIEDKADPHHNPREVPHTDFMKHTFAIPVSAFGLQILQSVSTSIRIDLQKQEGSAECHFIGANYMTWIVMYLYLRHFPELRDSSIRKVASYKTARDYADELMELVPELHKLREKYMEGPFQEADMTVEKLGSRPNHLGIYRDLILPSAGIMKSARSSEYKQAWAYMSKWMQRAAHWFQQPTQVRLRGLNQSYYLNIEGRAK